MDYEKAFDSVETNAVIQALKNQGIHTAYIRTTQEIYRNATTVLKLHQDSEPITIKKGSATGRHHVTIKLFVATLEEIFKKVNLEDKQYECEWNVNEPSKVCR